MKSTKYQAPKWRFRYLLHTMGTYNETATRLEQRGYPRLPKNTIQTWAHRNSIPAAWLPAILSLALEGRWITEIDDLKEKRHVKRPPADSHPQP